MRHMFFVLIGPVNRGFGNIQTHITYWPKDRWLRSCRMGVEYYYSATNTQKNLYKAVG